MNCLIKQPNYNRDTLNDKKTCCGYTSINWRKNEKDTKFHHFNYQELNYGNRVEYAFDEQTILVPELILLLKSEISIKFA